ncbi:MAG: questin oxidase family protein [Planctomycetota bacterium]
MELDRRRLLVAGGACLTSCAARARHTTDAPETLDLLLEAHADVLPERAGAGANHYPMAAEALVTLGHAQAIEPDWIRGAAGYAGEERHGSARLERDALGDYGRFADWRAHFRDELARGPWQALVAEQAPRLAPGLSGAAFHGLIRTAHAVRALRERDTPARRGELANGLAYWAARYAELPTNPALVDRPDELERTLTRLTHPWIDDDADVDFSAVDERLARAALAPPVELDDDPATELDALVHAAASAFLEMLVQERQRIWLLHTVTGPAAAGLLLPEVDSDGARLLVAHARQAVVALQSAFGAPYTPGAHLRASPPAWPELVQRAVASRSVHSIKLVEALRRQAGADPDPLWRTVAVQWLEWV